MKINEQVHLIRNDFLVTEGVKRYINIYLIVGESCYLIDSGVNGAEKEIAAYMNTIGRDIKEIRGIFLTHAHPDHIGAAAAIRRMTGCTVYAPAEGVRWMEDIEVQFAERPIPNFHRLLSESVKIGHPLCDGERIHLEPGLSIQAIATHGHSNDSTSYLFNEEILFVGDAVPAPNDLPIFVDFAESIESMDKIQGYTNAVSICPAWDTVYDRERLLLTIEKSKAMMHRLRTVSKEVFQENPELSDTEKKTEICNRLGLAHLLGNPLFSKSLDACLVP